MLHPGRLPFLLFLTLLGVAPALAAGDKPVAPRVVLSSADADALAAFERKATLAKRLGATHVPLTDGLPPAKWQFQPAR